MPDQNAGHIAQASQADKFILTPPEGAAGRKWSVFVGLGEPGWPRRHVEILYLGSVGTAKTSALVVSAIVRGIQYPGARMALVGIEKEVVKKTALKTLQERAQPLFQDETLKWVASEDKVLFSNGSELYILGLKDQRAADRLLGTEWAALYFDQAERLSPKLYVQALYRIRQQVYDADGNRNFPYAKLTANADTGSTTWLHRRFIIGSRPFGKFGNDLREKKVVTNIKGVKTTTYRAVMIAEFGENKSLHPDYIKVIAAAGVTSFLDDEFAKDSELFFPQFDYDVHVKEWKGEEKPPSNYSLMVGVDYGTDSPFAFVMGSYDRFDDVLHVHTEYHESGLDATDAAEILASHIAPFVKKGYRAIYVRPDPWLWNNTGLGRLIDVFESVFHKRFGEYPIYIEKGYVKGKERLESSQLVDTLRTMMRSGKFYIDDRRAQETTEVISYFTLREARKDPHPATDLFDSLRYLAGAVPVARADEEDEEDDLEMLERGLTNSRLNLWGH